MREQYQSTCGAVVVTLEEINDAAVMAGLRREPVRRFYLNSGEFETVAEHTSWCVGCDECWPEEN